MKNKIEVGNDCEYSALVAAAKATKTLDIIYLDLKEMERYGTLTTSARNHLLLLERTYNTIGRKLPTKDSYCGAV